MDLIDFARGAPEVHCGSFCSDGLRCMRRKVEKFWTFQAADRPIRLRYAKSEIEIN